MILWINLKVKFPNELSILKDVVAIRHDIIHRNGKDRYRRLHELGKSEIENLAKEIVRIMILIDTQVKDIYD